MHVKSLKKLGNVRWDRLSKINLQNNPFYFQNLLKIFIGQRFNLASLFCIEEGANEWRNAMYWQKII